MAKRLYVGNLPYSMGSQELQGLFETFGSVKSAQVLSDRETGRSRGFGFVEMDNDGEALKAIESLDGQDHAGRRLTVNEARARQAGGPGGGGGGGGYGGGGGGSRGGYGGGGGGYGGNRGGGGYGESRGSYSPPPPETSYAPSEDYSDRGGYGKDRDRSRDRDRDRQRKRDENY